MSVTLTRNGISVTAETQTELFEQMALQQEVFGIVECGRCHQQNLKYVVREDDDENKYFELRCQDCRAKLAFGQHKKGGTLFPRRKDEEGKWIPNGGWVIWNPETKKEE